MLCACAQHRASGARRQRSNARAQAIRLARRPARCCGLRCQRRSGRCQQAEEPSVRRLAQGRRAAPGRRSLRRRCIAQHQLQRAAEARERELRLEGARAGTQVQRQKRGRHAHRAAQRGAQRGLHAVARRCGVARRGRDGAGGVEERNADVGRADEGRAVKQAQHAAQQVRRQRRQRQRQRGVTVGARRRALVHVHAASTGPRGVREWRRAPPAR